METSSYRCRHLAMARGPNLGPTRDIPPWERPDLASEALCVVSTSPHFGHIRGDCGDGTRSI